METRLKADGDRRGRNGRSGGGRTFAVSFFEDGHFEVGIHWSIRFLRRGGGGEQEEGDKVMALHYIRELGNKTRRWVRRRQ